jgi:hypothetical protein
MSVMLERASRQKNQTHEPHLILVTRSTTREPSVHACFTRRSTAQDVGRFRDGVPPDIASVPAVRRLADVVLNRWITVESTSSTQNSVSP